MWHRIGVGVALLYTKARGVASHRVGVALLYTKARGVASHRVGVALYRGCIY